MQKVSLILLTVLALALLTSMVGLAASSKDSEVQRVGLVVAYTAGQSITIADRDGVQYTFTIASNLKIVPPERANMLGVGSYVTIIAPNNVPNGKSIAVGIVIHPQMPSSFPLPSGSFTPLPTDTAVPTETALSTEVASETPTATPTATETPAGVETATETVTPTATTAVASAAQTKTQGTVNSFIEWLASLFRQFLASSK
jgi:hypothetical protein